MGAVGWAVEAASPVLPCGTELALVCGQGVIANVKHYINNNQETNRGTVSANVDERTEHEVGCHFFVCAWVCM